MITRKTTDLTNIDFQSGEALLIDKPQYWSSFKVVHEVRKVTGVKKVGHAGTLDPMATGLLILCTGKKTKEINIYQEQEKTYTGTILLGKSSPSMDLETEILINKKVDVSDEDILNMKNKFTGDIYQVPPMYSAIKLGGKTLYNLARKGKSVEREPRLVNVSKFEIKEINLPEIHFEIICSKGTYIRVIANDFGEMLGCGGLLSSLRRTGIGSYSVDDAFQVEEFKQKFERLKTEN